MQIKKGVGFVAIVLALIFLILRAFGNGLDTASPTTYLWITTFVIIFITAYMFLVRSPHTESHKLEVFWILTILIAGSSIFLAVDTIHHNITSETGGPVHWHMDYQVWNCDEQLDLIDPIFPRNKVGSPVFHEHNDDRIHVEGTLHKISDVALGKYFTIVGGELSSQGFSYPTVDEVVHVSNGDICDGQPGELAVYVNGKKRDNYISYVMSPEALVPPGDCTIIEFGVGLGDTTERICDSWAANGVSYE
jgi:hypothetical protein